MKNFEIRKSNKDPKGYYHILGVNRGSSQSEIKKAYKAMMLVKFCFLILFG